MQVARAAISARYRDGWSVGNGELAIFIMPSR